jgi:hypothetical protein
MALYRFDKCGEMGIKNLETIARLWNLDEEADPEGMKQWIGQTNYSHLLIKYDKANILPVLVQTDPNKSHLINPQVKQMINDLLYVLDLNIVYKGDSTPYDMNEFKQEF